MTGIGHVSTLTMLQHFLSRYGAIGKIDLEENSVKMMGTYDPTEPLDLLIEQLEKEREFVRAGGQMIADAIMVSKGITLLDQTAMINEDIRECRRQTTDQKTWEHFNIFFTKPIASIVKR